MEYMSKVTPSSTSYKCPNDKQLNVVIESKLLLGSKHIYIYSNVIKLATKCKQGQS